MPPFKLTFIRVLHSFTDQSPLLKSVDCVLHFGTIPFPTGTQISFRTSAIAALLLLFAGKADRDCGSRNALCWTATVETASGN